MSIPQQQIIAEAAEWLVRMQSNPLSHEEIIEHQQWCASSPMHQQAWNRAAILLDNLHQLPTQIALNTLNRTELLDSAESLKRRALLSTASASIIGLPLIGFGLCSLHGDSHWLASHQTSTGQQARIALGDGSELLLNTRSAVHWNAERRQLRLLEGELLLHNQIGNVPIDVLSQSSQVRLLDGKLLLRQLNHTSLIAQLEGQSQIFSTAKNLFNSTLIANQQVRISERSHPVHPVQLQRTLSAWETGMLVADAMPLRMFVEELGRYRPGVIQLASALEQKRVSGAYPVLDTNLTLKMLAATYSLRINRRWNDYWIAIETA